ncbi:CBF/NF-Y family transcription factor [Histoplasma capsulatum H143]|uniref:CBF/NF-Y family transcription factor n=1 Tax=Ajellomyces capsulatus (strain H143) TaxID=544712 RepID=C6H5E0_AJECH|nr:CBF/NF-Y family transcription factor [Histoplasma capsulatum H143]
MPTDGTFIFSMEFSTLSCFRLEYITLVGNETMIKSSGRGETIIRKSVWLGQVNHHGSLMLDREFGGKYICPAPLPRRRRKDHRVRTHRESVDGFGFRRVCTDVLAVAEEHREQLKSREKKVNKMEQSGLTEEELLRQQQELFRCAGEKYNAAS